MMRFANLIESTTTPYITHGSMDGLYISTICNDSRKVIPGALFAAIPGYKHDGRAYALEAYSKGAVALLTPAPMDIPYPVQIVARDVREALGEMVSAFFGKPSLQMEMYGVTGTNGKTTTTHFLESVLAVAGFKTGLIGTVYVKFNGTTYPSKMTSPDSPELQSILRDMVDNGVEASVMEISSHALALKRLSGCGFNGVGITNVTHDHLDFHQSFDAYKAAKLSIIDLLHMDEKKPGFIVANINDNTYSDIVARCPSPVVSFGFDSRADVFPISIEATQWGASCSFRTPQGQLHADVRLPGRHNIANAMAAICFAYASGIGLEVIARGIEALKYVPGRFQPVEGRLLHGLVDFAHNPDGLYSLLRSARDMTRGRLILVFGCQGRRDPFKRPIMGSIAARMADEVILTTDDVYDESPEEIAKMVVQGYEHVRPEGLTIQWRRDQAIEDAVAKANPDDLIIVAGRGPEEKLILGDETFYFNDAHYLEQCITRREEGGNH